LLALKENLRMLTRRRVLTGLVGLGGSGIGLGGYALAESYGLDVTSYRVSPAGWPQRLKLRLLLVADLHACQPWMSPHRIRGIVEAANGLEADAILLLGDYVVGSRLRDYASPIPHGVWARELAGLRAPNGVHAVLGNHDWWDDDAVQDAMAGIPPVRTAIEAAGIPVYENNAVRLTKDGQPFWVAGLGDQWAFFKRKHRVANQRDGRVPRYIGVDDLPATLASVKDDAPVILMAHEPDIFPQVPARVALTVSGHTHGGQVRVFGYAPVVPSRYGRRYAYGHIVENDRHLVVSAGLGCSGAPVRIGAPPELVVIDLAAPAMSA
jgi:predicted MPP superfamily phosphohydrolase